MVLTSVVTTTQTQKQDRLAELLGDAPSLTRRVLMAGLRYSKGPLLDETCHAPLKSELCIKIAESF